MEDGQAAETGGRRRGRPPAPNRSNLIKVTLTLDEDDTEWGKRQPGGLSELVRRLIAEAREAESDQKPG